MIVPIMKNYVSICSHLARAPLTDESRQSARLFTKEIATSQLNFGSFPKPKQLPNDAWSKVVAARHGEQLFAPAVPLGLCKLQRSLLLCVFASSASYAYFWCLPTLEIAVPGPRLGEREDERQARFRRAFLPSIHHLLRRRPVSSSRCRVVGDDSPCRERCNCREINESRRRLARRSITGMKNLSAAAIPQHRKRN